MNLWFRFFATLIAAQWRTSLSAPLGRSKLRFRVWPLDLDINLHMNNGRYLTIMDLGRMDMIMRMGLVRPMLQRGWMPVLTSSTIRYRRELKLFEPFDMETAIVYWQGSIFVMEHKIRFTRGARAGAVAATALVKGGFYNRKERSFISIEKMSDVFGFEQIDSPPITPAITALLAAEEAIRAQDNADTVKTAANTTTGSDQPRGN